MSDLKETAYWRTKWIETNNDLQMCRKWLIELLAESFQQQAKNPSKGLK